MNNYSFKWNPNKNKENEIFQETLIRIKNAQDSTMSPLIFPSSSMFLRFMLITCISFSRSLDDIPSAKAQSNAFEWFCVFVATICLMRSPCAQRVVSKVKLNSNGTGD